MATYRNHNNHVYEDESDADDEYDSIIQSPTLPQEYHSHSSPTDSESLSTEHTPTSYSHRESSPRGLITEWNSEQVADFISSLGLPQYADHFIEEAIRGDSLVEMHHSDLKTIGIASIGHRLTILKSTYDVKVKQGLPLDPDHFAPRTAEPEILEPPTQDDITTIIRIIKDRDVEIRNLRESMDRLMDENRKLREDVLPLITQAKNRSQPLPTPEERDSAAAQAPEVVQPKTAGGGLSRKFSTKRIFLGNGGPKNPSPTTINETQPLSDPSVMNASAAALVASNHLTASLRDVSSPNQTVPSPTSPAYQIQPPPSSTGPTQRGFARTESLDRDAWNTTFASAPDRSRSAMDNPPLSGGGQVKTPGSTTGSTSGGQGSGGAPSRDQVEIFKSFRVSIDDPCHKVLPVALKKYNITADWRQYALYIVHGDQERCLGLNEKPLILFKQLDREGRKPMFMLRKHATPQEGHYTQISHAASAVQIPGGVL